MENSLIYIHQFFVVFFFFLDEEDTLKNSSQYTDEHSDNNLSGQVNGKIENDEDNEQEEENKDTLFSHEMEIEEENNLDDEASSYCDSFYSGKFILKIIKNLK